MGTRSFVVLLAAVTAMSLSGCVQKKADITGTFSSASPPATLTLEGGRFTLKMGPDTVEGESSQLQSTLALHPKTLNGLTQEQATAKAFKDAQEMGIQVDMQIQGTVFDPVKIQISEDGKSLTFEDEPILKGGKQPYYNALNTLTRS